MRLSQNAMRLADPDSHHRASVSVNPAFEEIRAIAATLRDLHSKQVAALAPIVQDILHTRSRNVREIEATLDHLLDCACIPEGLTLFKSLCRYYFTINANSAFDYVNAYREMWDDEAEETIGGAQ